MEKKQNFVSNSTESVRIFKNDFFEFFSKCAWYVPVLFWVPIASLLLYVGMVNSPVSVGKGCLLFLIGFVVWSFFEYLIHRFIFHWEPTKKGGTAERLHVLLHGFHHNYPSDKLRLVAPLPLSLAIAIPIELVFYLITRDLWISLILLSGTTLSYLWYDLTHYMLHHSNLQWRLLKNLKKAHLSHHYTDDHKNFGVSPLGVIWDYIFKTK